MSFDVPADAYTRFMGRFSEPLAVRFAAFAGVTPGAVVLDVGCGPGALTGELRGRYDAQVSAVDPSASFTAALAERFPQVDVHTAGVENLPFPDEFFEFTLAQLVVHFMPDPVTGLRGMRDVTASGGVVAACVWDHAGDRGPLSPFWRAVREVEPGHPGEGDLPGAREGHLAALFAAAGLEDVEAAALEVAIPIGSFEEWWEPFTLGVGPAGAYVAALDEDRRRGLRDLCAGRLPPAPFTATARAWAARGRALP